MPTTPAPPEHPSGGAARGRLLTFAVPALLAIVVLIAASLALGAVRVPLRDIWPALIGNGNDDFSNRVIDQIRLPRVLCALMVGGALALGGALLQTITRNPLADPTILGVSAASGLATSIGLVAMPLAPRPAMAFAAVLGGLIGAGVMLLVAQPSRATGAMVSPLRITLSGVAVAAFFGSAIIGLLSTNRTFLQISIGFLVGGLYAADWPHFTAALPWFGGATAVALLLAPRLAVLALGDEVAAGLGVSPTQTRALGLIATGVLTGVAVSISGMVGFVGLVSPHLARFAVGAETRRLLPASILTGGLLVGSADLAARLVVHPAEIPMGIITAAVGAPFLLYLLRTRA